MSFSTPSTIAPEDVARLAALADEWWDPEGAFHILHRIHPLRIQYVREQICLHFHRKITDAQPCAKLHVLDIGCGGGLMAEALAGFGAKATGLDASPEAIRVAERHARHSGLRIDYRVGGPESLEASKPGYDVILAMEVVEHVADLDAFFSALKKHLKPNGLLLLSTLNRTWRSYVFGIWAAEYVLGWAPRGAHNWHQFVRPSELALRLEQIGLRTGGNQFLVGEIAGVQAGRFRAIALALR
ncbi:MAG: bifunctional 2-polyprenyl-6-hydroxyphenol methylase/3-demethylubiquinol 3-O-methyltransferase UbiG, partial [Alphaproteobacteria bacterium]|nr:bifunctional 2-polyprenyl-6-hydroxyphenol methylase/3-demethylubiquinol 3-O-methyltransferase UbiG [Alphaproteobacteria bacterium]